MRDITLTKISCRAVRYGDRQFSIRVWAKSKHYGPIYSLKFVLWNNGGTIKLQDEIMEIHLERISISHIPQLMADIQSCVQKHWDEIKPGSVGAKTGTNGWRSTYQWIPPKAITYTHDNTVISFLEEEPFATENTTAFAKE